MVRLKVQFIIIYNTACISLNGFYEQLCHLLFKKKKKKQKKRKMNLICFRQLWGGQARILGTEDA